MESAFLSLFMFHIIFILFKSYTFLLFCITKHHFLKKITLIYCGILWCGEGKFVYSGVNSPLQPSTKKIIILYLQHVYFRLSFNLSLTTSSTHTGICSLQLLNTHCQHNHHLHREWHITSGKTISDCYIQISYLCANIYRLHVEHNHFSRDFFFIFLWNILITTQEMLLT